MKLLVANMANQVREHEVTAAATIQVMDVTAHIVITTVAETN